MFVIEDERHAESGAGFRSLDAAIHELRRLASVPWDQKPNQAPCRNWRRCGRRYEVVEYDTIVTPWTEVRRLGRLSISSAGVEWAAEFEREASL